MTRERDREQLVLQIPLLSSLEAEDRRRVAQLIHFRRYTARASVVHEGDPGNSLFLVLSGYLKAVTRGTEGREMLLSVMGPGEVFGELSLLDGKPRSCSCVALESAELASIERDAVLGMLRTSPELGIQLLEVVTQRLRNLSERCESITSLDVSGRLARVVLNLADKHGERAGPGIRVRVKLSQQELGDMVGATRESVNKLLGDWKQAGLLHQEEGRVVITDVDALRRMV